MRILYDAIGAPDGSGGPKLHAHEVLKAWAVTFPGDEITAIGPSWIRDLAASHTNIRHIRWESNSAASRILGQMFFTPLIARMFPRRALLVSLPVLSPMAPAGRSFIYAHDWRHLSNPDEFSRGRRLYRKIWASSVRRATATFAISAKTVSETVRLFTGAQVVLAENGADHVLSWPNSDRPDWLGSKDLRFVVTPGHRPNKRSDLVIAAIARIEETQRPHLVVLGAVGDLRDSLIETAEALGVASWCLFPGFVSQAEYAYAVRTAECLIMASSDEGFGLPVAEALFCGTPVVAARDSGLGEVFDGSITLAAPDAESLAAALLYTAGRQSKWNGASTWKDNVTVVRSTVQSMTKGTS